MFRPFAERLSRGMPLALSGAIHAALLATLLVVSARLAPPIDAVIHAELVPPDVGPPRSPTPRPDVKAPPKPRTPPAARPLELPRLLDAPAPAAPPSTPIEAPPVARPVPLPSPEAPQLQIKRAESLPSPEPAQPNHLARALRDAAPAPAASGSPGHAASADIPGPGISMLAAVDDRAGTDAAGAPRATGGGNGDARGTGAGGEGRGPASGGTSGNGMAGNGISRMAIPRGGYQVQPRYPSSARRLGIQGTTLLRVFVAVDGRVADVGVERTAGHADLDEAAADAVRRWRFEPARRGDEPVAMWVLLPVEFRLK